MRRLLALLGLTTACQTAPSDDARAATPCAYPEGAAEPMALDAVLSPYRWPKAIHADGREAPLDLSGVHCGRDGEVDWSPFDALLFVSLPAL